MPGSPFHSRCAEAMDIVHLARRGGIYPYFRCISGSKGTEVEVDGKWAVMLASNDYLGLTQHPWVLERAAEAARKRGSGAGGSRFLSGNLGLHHELEERLADWVGKRRALLHVTGFSTNLGALGAVLQPGDTVICDRESHASILSGCQASRAKLRTFVHNDVPSAKAKLDRARENDPQSLAMLVTEGVFSMSGDLGRLDELAALKADYPNCFIYLDDAHGMGVMGPGGRGSAAHFGATERIDFIMGTFSKALASVGGFIAGDDELVMDYLRHRSSTMIFSAALPAYNTAAALAALDMIQREPERIERLHRITRRVRAAYREMGLITSGGDAPILPIHIGDEVKAGFFSRELLENGVFALPVVYPAVPKGKALVRTAFMSTHTGEQIDRALEALARLAATHRIRSQDIEQKDDAVLGV